MKIKIQQIFTRYCGSSIEFISQIDDDTVLDYDNLAESLKDVDQSDLIIACPTVLRNQIIWRHPEASIMGKWAWPIGVITVSHYYIRCIIQFGIHWPNRPYVD